ncbi:phosphate ABC transporter permease subunit PstC [Angustibacter aerolatus]|uniref:Phosphate transport system permease protein n=1 Tax=Angustibacter aerolatus TaxID=1162965 RepID=A0ABQ6JL30_9ACTN|nr:phosphate ABC transporter permease subunit PstC [Angustibacter aerolatus]GMA87557.1 phosphate transport system permease protein [Angustibacter aerolatus]
MSSVTGASVVDTLGGGEDSGDRASTGRLGDRLFAGAATGSGIIVIGLVTLVGAFLLYRAIPALADDDANFLTSRVFDVDSSPLRFGIADLLWVTVISSVIAMIIAVPVAIGVALFITQYAPRRLAAPAAYLVDLLAAVPSIVYGLWGARVIGSGFNEHVQDPIQNTVGKHVPFLRDVGISAGTILLISLVLSIMILPIITALSREVFAQTPPQHKEGAIALGATKWEMITTAVLPFGRPGVISAAMLGLGRALGETIAVTIILSTIPATKPWSFSLFNGGETFASRIANNASEFDSPGKTGAFIAAGLVLFILTFAVNAAARVVIERRKAFSE